MSRESLEEQLAKAEATIRALQDELAETNRGLVALSMELEQRVEQRATELARSNEALRAEIAERERADDALRQSEERYRTLFSTLIEGFCIIEVVFDADAKPVDYRFLEINPAFEKQTGLQNAQGRLMRELAPDHEAHWFEIYGNVALTGRPARFVNEAKALDRWYDVSAYRVGGPESRKVGILFNDITERMRAEAALQSAKVSAERAKAAAEEATQAKDQFLAVLSHELRTPLTPVLAAVQLMQRKPNLSEDMRHPLEIICRNVQLQARLIDDLLDLTRIVQGKLVLVRKPLDISTVIERAVEISKPDLDARKLHFGVEINGGPHRVNGDASRLQQLMWNLLSNAVKFTPDGGCVGIRCHRQDSDVIIEVIDSGMGIEPEARDRIFDAFEQGGRAITRRFGGLGLGLAIAKRLVDMHEGTLSAYSEGRDTGSTFRISLPLVSTELCTEAEKHASIARGPSKRILLVEDNGDTAETMKMLLEIFGYQVETAGDVAQALRAIASQDFDLLISDLGLPDQSGLELMQELRRRGNGLKGIALSGYGREEDVRRSREAGFTAHLTKPVDVDALVEIIAGII